MSYIAMNQYAKWFGRVVWLGILANFALALPTLFLAGRNAGDDVAAFSFAVDVAEFRGAVADPS